LVQVDQRLNSLFLTDDFGAQSLIESVRIIAADAWIKLLANGCSHDIILILGRKLFLL